MFALQYRYPRSGHGSRDLFKRDEVSTMTEATKRIAEFISTNRKHAVDVREYRGEDIFYRGRWYWDGKRSIVAHDPYGDV